MTRRAENSIVKVVLWCAVLLMWAIFLPGAKPARSVPSKPARAVRPAPVSSWRDERLAFAFDLPEGWSADSLDRGGTLVVHRGEDMFSFAVQVEDWPVLLEQPLSNSADTLVSYVTQQFATTCDFVGTDVDRYPDRLRSIQHDRSRRGVDVVEFTVEVAEVPGGDLDLDSSAATEDAAPDSLLDAAPDSALDARPDGELDANPDSVPEITTDSMKAGPRRFIVGPSFLVDLSKPGWPLRVWVLPNCNDPTTSETAETARAVVRSLRRL